MTKSFTNAFNDAHDGNVSSICPPSPEYTGKYEGYSRDGKIKVSGEYLGGERHGDWEYVGENGLIMMSEEYNARHFLIPTPKGLREKRPRGLLKQEYGEMTFAEMKILARQIEDLSPDRPTANELLIKSVKLLKENPYLADPVNKNDKLLIKYDLDDYSKFLFVYSLPLESRVEDCDALVKMKVSRDGNYAICSSPGVRQEGELQDLRFGPAKEGEWQLFTRLPSAAQNFYDPRNDDHAREEGSYVEGQKNGTWREYHCNGTGRSSSSESLISEGEYLHGEKVGVWKYYNTEESLMSEGEYLRGEKVGAWKYYNTDGSLKNIDVTDDPAATAVLNKSLGGIQRGDSLKSVIDSRSKEDRTKDQLAALSKKHKLKL